jgi:hypothetical protein
MRPVNPLVQDKRRAGETCARVRSKVVYCQKEISSVDCSSCTRSFEVMSIFKVGNGLIAGFDPDTGYDGSIRRCLESKCASRRSTGDA